MEEMTRPAVPDTTKSTRPYPALTGDVFIPVVRSDKAQPEASTYEADVKMHAARALDAARRMVQETTGQTDYGNLTSEVD